MIAKEPTPNFSAPPSKTVSPIKLAHVVLRTPQMSKMVAFYTTFLGARVVFGSDSATFLTYDEEHHRVALIGMPELQPKDLKTAGLEHFSFTFSTLSDLFMAYRQRKAAGIKPVWCINHGPMISLYYRDPDGNMIETQVDTFDTAEETNEYIATEEFAKNPFGVDIDPEEFIARLEAGEDERELAKRPDIGARELPDLDAMW